MTPERREQNRQWLTQRREGIRDLLEELSVLESDGLDPTLTAYAMQGARSLLSELGALRDSLGRRAEMPGGRSRS